MQKCRWIVGIAMAVVLILIRVKSQKEKRMAEESDTETIKLIRYSNDLGELTGDVYGWDLETGGLDFNNDPIALIQIYDPKANVIALLHVRGRIDRSVKDFFQQPDKVYIGHNIGMFDLLFLKNAGININMGQKWFDTLVGECVITASARRDIRVSLQATTQRRLGTKLKKDSGGHTWMNLELDPQQETYAVEDVIYLPQLADSIIQKARDTNQLDALNLEMDNITVITGMTYNGMPISEQKLAKTLEDKYKESLQLKYKLLKIFDNITLNLNSSQQMVRAFAKIGISINSIAADVLEELALAEDEDGPIHTFINYKTAAKFGQMYGAKFQSGIFNWRVYPRFWQCGTDTGRASSTGPNCQQIPKSARKIFTAQEGHKIIAADYSQIEILVEAYLAQDQKLIDAVLGGDVHSAVCRQIFNFPEDYLSIESIHNQYPSIEDPEELDNILSARSQEFKEKRKLAKALIFTMLFGGGAARFYEYAHNSGSTITLAMAQDLMKKFFISYPQLYKMRQTAIAKCQRAKSVGHFEIRLPTGLRRIIVGPKLKPTTILNTAVQGTAAGGLKYAINECKYTQLSNGKYVYEYLIAMVHDELVAHVPTHLAEEYGSLLKQCMVKGMQKVLDDQIMINVEVSIDDEWK
jgi:DNA polymerase-1